MSYEAGRAIVGFDAALTSPEEFIEQLERMTGFTAEIVQAVGDSTRDKGAGGASAVHDKGGSD